MAELQDDTEISLGAGKLLLLFFGLVMLCGSFFGVGYMIGKNSAAPQVVAAEPATAPATASAPKPSPSISHEVAPASAKTPDCAATPEKCDQQPEDTTRYYDNVGQKDVKPKLEEQPSPAAATSMTKAVARADAPKPVTAAAPTIPGTGYIVQVAAVSKQQDAETLVNALRKKQYPVFITNNPPNDKLFHVQAGPFADIKEAEAVKARLINDGYSPMLKR